MKVREAKAIGDEHHEAGQRAADRRRCTGTAGTGKSIWQSPVTALWWGTGRILLCREEQGAARASTEPWRSVVAMLR